MTFESARARIPLRVRRLTSEASPERALFEVAKTLPAPAFLDSTLTSRDAWTILTAAPVGTIVDDLPPWFPDTAAHDSPGGEALPRPASDPEAVVPPFGSGWIGFLTYESAPLWNRDLASPRQRPPRPDEHPPAPEPGFVFSGPGTGAGTGAGTEPGSTTGALSGPLSPRALWHRYEASLAYRHTDRSWWLSASETEAGSRAAAQLMACFDRAGGIGSERPGLLRNVHVGEMRADLSRDDYLADVETLREWIARGHVYQANLTYRMRAAFEGRGLDLYPRLRRTSPVPFGAYFRPTLPGTDASSSPLEILAATPELLVSVYRGRVATRPIKGTRPRDLSDPSRDRTLARELFTSPKDRAELTMIVDLERNDLGRICKYGSVRTSAFPRVESYRGVHHLVADVAGDLREDASFLDLLHATFPGGSVTGAPKIRAMELIGEIERSPREIYTGALGYLDDRGSAVLSLTIRTLWITPGPGREVRFGVGGGIVTDSVPEQEWQETQDKARTLLEALELARAVEASPLGY